MIKKVINPQTLTAKQKEAYNFQKVSSLLADYGYQTIKLADDWGGVDFIAQHLDGTFLMVQLKGRLVVERKYENKELWMCFPNKEEWYIYPHDEVLEKLKNEKRSTISSTYDNGGGYSFPYMTKELIVMMEQYKINRPNKALQTTSASARV